MKEPKPILIDNFQRGINQGPFEPGFSDMRNIDGVTRPGSGRINFALTIVSVSGGTMTKPKYITQDPVALTYFLQDDSGQIFKATAGSPGSWTLVSGNTVNGTTSGNGLVVFNNYLLAFTPLSIETYGPLNSSPAWTTAWKVILGSSAQDHVPYYNPTNGLVYWSEFYDASAGPTLTVGTSGLGSLLQVPGKVFLPSDSTTYTLTTGNSAGAFALQVPTGHKITCITLLGSQLRLGTNQALIYPWDTYSSTYDLPLITKETNVTSLIADGSILYYACGNRGNLYIFDGYQSKLAATIPPYLTGIPTNSCTITSLTKHNGRIYFGVGCIGCSGVWSYNPNTNAIALEHVISSGIYGTLNAISISVLFSVASDQILTGWSSNESGVVNGLDIQASTFFRNTSYTAYFETEFFNTGLPNAPRNLANFDIMMGANLQSGHGIKIYSRADNLTAYSATPDVIFDFATFGAVDSMKLPFGKSFVNVQFKVVLTTGGSNTTTPQLNSIQIN